MAEREYLDDNNGELIRRLRDFCEFFVKTFEKKVNEIKEEEIIYDELSLIKDDKNFRKMLAFAAGEIFWCFQNQFILVTDRRNSVSMGMNILAFDGASRCFDYIYSKKQKKINNKTFCEFITEGIILGKSKSRHIIKYKNNFFNTSELYEDVGILEIKQDESKKYYNRKGSSCNFSYRFSFSGESFNDFSVKTYASGKEPIIYCDLPKNMLKEQLKNILRIINGEEIVWNINEKVDHNMLLVSNVATNLNNIQPTIEDISRDTLQVKADVSEIKPTIEDIHNDIIQVKADISVINTNENTTQIASDVSEIKNIIKNEATKNDQHKTNHVWFDMRKPVTTFTGRIEILETLHRTLHHATGSAVISQATSVSGLGGIGKSELSRKYAIEYQDAYDGNLIWINAETHESLKDSFVRLADQLNIPVKDKKIESIILNIYKEFGKGKCLFIFDNAEEYKIIKEFLPLLLPSNIQTPHILITSRNQKWQLADTGAMDVINLECFTPGEALEFIKNTLGIKNNIADAEITIVAKELDSFPLALGQAVAYIKMEDEREKKFHGKTFGVSDYLKAYKDESLKAELLEHRHENSQYNKTVLTTWNITLKNIEKENKGSIKIIEIMAYLAPDSIKPDEIFSESTNVKEDVIDFISNKINKMMSNVFPDFIKPDVSFSEFIKDEKKRQDAIYLLLNYSMINIKNRVLSIHRLVQEVIRLQIKGKGKETGVLKKVLKLLGFNLRTVDKIHLISVWSYACDNGKIIDEFLFKYESYGYDDKKLTPLNLIVESGNIDAVKKILNHLKKKSKKKFQKILNYKEYDYDDTPLDISIRQNNLEMSKVLFEFGAKKNNKICVKTIFDGRVDLVKYFYPNNDEYLLHAKFYSALKSKNVESVNNLLNDLKNEQIKNLMEQKLTNLDPKLFIYELPPLVFAALSGNLNLLKLLVINYGADINFSCDLGTSLHAAVINRHLEIMKFLIENGANCNAVDCNGWTVLHYAALYGHLEIIKYLIENTDCDINATNKSGETALHSAALHGRLEIVKYLIENNKCDINATDKWGETALDYATECYNLEVVEYLTKKLNERKLI